MQKYDPTTRTLKIDVSDGKANYSQRNNQYTHKANSLDVNDVTASTMCNVTSLCQSGDYNGYIFPKGKYSQPEDNFADFIMNSKEVDDYYRIHCPALYNDYVVGKHSTKNGKTVIEYYTPNEVHCVLAYAFNQWLGFTADTFKENAPIMDIVNELIEGRSCVISGVFNRLHHIVSLVGCEWKFNNAPEDNEYRLIENIKKNKILPTKFIIDDPYGKWNAPNGYKSGLSGNNAELTRDQFFEMIKPVNNKSIKYCHLLKQGAVTI